MVKRFALFLAAMLVALPLHATNFVLNSDFADGLGHWYGDARTPADFAQDNGQMAPDPANAKGVVIPINSSRWRKLAQDFQGDINGGTITITFQLSPDFTASQKPDDYTGVPHKISYDGWKPFDIKTGNWLLFISDFGTSRGTYWPVPFKSGAGPLTMKFNVTKLTPHEDKTITLAFPPGTGTITILHVSVDTAGDAAPPPPDPNAIPKL